MKADRFEWVTEPEISWWPNWAHTSCQVDLWCKVITNLIYFVNICYKVTFTLKGEQGFTIILLLHWKGNKVLLSFCFYTERGTRFYYYFTFTLKGEQGFTIILLLRWTGNKVLLSFCFYAERGTRFYYHFAFTLKGEQSLTSILLLHWKRNKVLLVFCQVIRNKHARSSEIWATLNDRFVSVLHYFAIFPLLSSMPVRRHCLKFLYFNFLSPSFSHNAPGDLLLFHFLLLSYHLYLNLLSSPPHPFTPSPS